MTTVNQTILDGSIRHMVWLERYKTSTVNKLIVMLNKADEDLIRQIAARMALIEGRGFDLGPETTKRLREMRADIQGQREALYASIQGKAADELQDFAIYEAGFQASLIEKSMAGLGTIDLNRPALSQLKAAVTSQPFQGRLLKEWFSSLAQDDARRINDAVRMGIVEGQTTDQIVRRIRGTKRLGYADGLLEISRRHTQTIVRTAVAHVSDRAGQSVWEANTDIIKGLKWVSTLDGRTSSLCRSRDGQIYPVKSAPPIPAHFGCLTGDALVSPGGRISGASKRWFDGEIIVIKTASGNKLSCTPNHPILTGSGWVAAGLLNVGGDVISNLRGEGPPSSVHGDCKDVPAPIHEVVEAFLGSRKVVTVPMPTTAEDFHGDGMDGHIAIVASNRKLWRWVYSPLFKEGKKLSFIVRGSIKFFERFRHFNSLCIGLLSSFGRRVCRFSKCLDFVRGSPAHSCKLLFRPIALLISSLKKDGGHGGVRTPDDFGDAFYADTVLVKFYNFVSFIACGLRDRFIFCAYSRLMKGTKDGSFADAKLARYILRGSAGDVFADEIIGIERLAFSGHVYNLECKKSFYIANGIVTHNCRSRKVPYLGETTEKGNRASQFGPVPEDMKYDRWLRGQSLKVQEEVLGVRKAQLFRNGGMDISRFQDATGKEYTLAELKKRDADIWNQTFTN